MPSIDSLSAFTLVAIALIVVPGPSVMFVIGRAMALGRRAALVTVAGNAVGMFVQVVLVAIGVGAIVERSIVVFNAVKLIGAGYLVWLGVQAIRHRRAAGAALADGDPPRSGRSVVVDGFVVGLANPKTIVFFAAILPQFVEPGGAPAAAQMLVLGAVFSLIALVLDSMWGLAAGTARAWFARSPRRTERLSAAGGVVMVALGLQLAVTGRSE